MLAATSGGTEAASFGSMRTLALGGALIDRIEEHCLPVSLTLLTSDEEFISRRVDPLPSGFLDRASMTFQFSMDRSTSTTNGSGKRSLRTSTPSTSSRSWRD